MFSLTLFVKFRAKLIKLPLGWTKTTRLYQLKNALHFSMACTSPIKVYHIRYTVIKSGDNLSDLGVLRSSSGSNSNHILQSSQLKLGEYVAWLGTLNLFLVPQPALTCFLISNFAHSLILLASVEPFPPRGYYNARKDST